MDPFADLTPEAARKGERAKAAAAAPKEAQDNKKAVAEHYAKAISVWASATGPAAIREKISIREDFIGDVANAWEASLKAKGYVVTRGDGTFTVSLKS